MNICKAVVERINQLLKEKDMTLYRLEQNACFKTSTHAVAKSRILVDFLLFYNKIIGKMQVLCYTLKYRHLFFKG